MAHLEPIPKNEEALKKNALGKKNKPKSGWKWLIFAGVLIIGGGQALSALWATSNQDDVSQEEQIQLEQQFAQIDTFKLEVIDYKDEQQAIELMDLSAAEKKKLKSTLENTNKKSPRRQGVGARLVWFDVWDFATQDGDIIRIESGGYSANVLLLEAHSRIALPLTSDKTIRITGIADGGGGITLGVGHAGIPVSMPVIHPGQELILNVNY